LSEIKEAEPITPDLEYGLNGYSLNPLQSLVWEHKESQNNMMVLGRTSSGKTGCAQIMAKKYLFEHAYEDSVVAFVGSFKAIGEERLTDLNEDSVWGTIPKAVISGDYAYTQEKLDEIANARLIFITPESMLAALTSKKGERAVWLNRVRFVVCDEIHLLVEEGRGAVYENAIIELLKHDPDIQLMGLSGTLKNHEDFLKWLTFLNGKPTHFIKSDYRPVELVYHFIPYTADRSAAKTEASRIRAIQGLVQSKPNEQFLIGVFKKAFGRKIVESLMPMVPTVEFHNGDIGSLAKRREIEKRFKTGFNKVLVSTKTLFVGVNLPARNVIVTAVSAGGGEIPSHEMQQLAGRAGRPKYDTEGDVYFLIPDDGQMQHHKDRIIAGDRIVSQMHKRQVMAAHFLRGVYRGTISDSDSAIKWFKHTLAFQQDPLRYTPEALELMIEAVYKDMADRNLLKRDETIGEYYITNKGKICAQMLLDPYTYADFVRNFRTYFSLQNPNDIDLSVAMGNVKLFEADYITIDEQKAIPTSISKVSPSATQKAVSAIYYKVKDMDLPPLLISSWVMVYQDLYRYREALIRTTNESEKWNSNTSRSAEETIKLGFLRAAKSMSWQEAELAVSKFKPSEVTALNKAGLFTVDDCKSNHSLTAQILKPSRMKELGIVYG
jgi:replicative superfamily II helicase